MNAYQYPKFIDDSLVAHQVSFLGTYGNKLTEKDQKFLKNLLKAYAAGKATVPQKYWLGVLAKRAADVNKEKIYEDMYGKPAEASAPMALNDYAGVYKLFDNAKKSGLLHPKIKLKVQAVKHLDASGNTWETGGGDLQLSIAGPKSKYNGKIMVTDGKDFGSNKWYGVIDQDGQFHQSHIFHVDKDKTEILSLLKDLGENSAYVATTYGKKTGQCCFCQKELTDPQSVAVGYGPICAGKWGLPHGGSVAAQAEASDDAVLKELFNNTPPKKVFYKNKNGKLEYGLLPTGSEVVHDGNAMVKPSPWDTQQKPPFKYYEPNGTMNMKVAYEELSDADTTVKENPKLPPVERKKKEYLF